MTIKKHSYNNSSNIMLNCQQFYEKEINNYRKETLNKVNSIKKRSSKWRIK